MPSRLEGAAQIERWLAWGLLRPVLAWQPRALQSLFGQQTLLPYMEGRASADPCDPAYPLYREAVELVTEDRNRRVRREVGRALASGHVSKFELLRRFAR